MKHSKFPYVLKVVQSGMPVLLTGTAGTGKSTLARQLADELSLKFHSVSCTKQMSVNALLGFISINGVYLRTQLRDAFEHGGLFLLDEIDAADPNVLLCLNTIENGFISFPDGIVDMHPDFRLIATSNPFNAHSTYTGRSKLDFSTIDRYFIIELERDDNLELYLTSPEIVEYATVARKILSDHGVTSTVTMRDTIRLHSLNNLGISDCIYKDVVFYKHEDLYDVFLNDKAEIDKEKAKSTMTQDQAQTIDELWEVIQRESKSETTVDEDFIEEAKRILRIYIETKNNPPKGWLLTRYEEFPRIKYEVYKTHTSKRCYIYEDELDIIPF